MDSDKREFLKNGYIVIIRKILDTLFFFANSILLAKVLGAEQKGQYTIFLLVSSIIFTFTNLGIIPSTIYYINHLEKEKKKDVVSINFRLSFGIIIIGLIVGIILIHFFSNIFFDGVEKKCLYIALLAFPGYFLVNNLLGILEAYKNFKAYSIFGLLQKAINIFLLLITMFFLKYNALSALIVYIVVQYVMFILLYIYINKYIIKIKIDYFDKNTAKEIIGYGIKSHLCNMLAYVNYRLDLFIIAFYLDNVAVGLYSVVVNLAEQIWTFSSSISTVLFPQLTALKDEEKRIELTLFVSRTMFLISVTISIIFFVFSTLLISILYGDEYLQAISAFKLLLPGIAIGGMTKILSNYISSTGKPEVNMKNSIVIVSVNAILNIILIPRYGINGAAIATTIGYFINAILKIIYLKINTNSRIRDIVIFKISDFNMFINILKKILHINKCKKC